MRDVTVPMFLPAPPPDGGFLVLNDAQIGNLDLVCMIKKFYPRTKLYAGNAAPAQVTGMAGYFARQNDTAHLLRAAMDKIKATSV